MNAAGDLVLVQTSLFLTCKLCSCGANSGLEINFFTQEPAGDLGEKFGRQIINFGRQLIGQYRTIPENPSTIVKYLLKM